MKNRLHDRLCPPSLHDLSALPYTAREREQKRAVRNRRFDRVTIGFWGGVIVLGGAGCVLGVCMPYSHPVAVVISVIWWAIYFGCFGGSIGALIALFTDHVATPRSQDPFPRKRTYVKCRLASRRRSRD